MGQEKVMWSGPFLIHGKPRCIRLNQPTRERKRGSQRSTKTVFDPGD